MTKTHNPELAALAFKVPETSYPSMSLCGDGTITPTHLIGQKQFTSVSQFLARMHVPEDSALPRWNHELIFFPVRRTSRIPKILSGLGLCAPTCYHAAVFGANIALSPVGGSIIFPHQGVSVEGIGPSWISYSIHERTRHVCVTPCSFAFRSPVWAVGVRVKR